jgi:hypothetical protein
LIWGSAFSFKFREQSRGFKACGNAKIANGHAQSLINCVRRNAQFTRYFLGGAMEQNVTKAGPLSFGQPLYCNALIRRLTEPLPVHSLRF